MTTHKLHFIWLGNPIPKKYLRNIIAFKRFCKSPVEVNLWTDRHNANVANLADGVSDSLINIRDVASLTVMASRLQNTDTQLAKKIKKLLVFIARECVGAYTANFAAASDILRVLILYFEGGMYLDCDLVPREKYEFPKPKHGFAFVSNEIGQVNNDVLIAQKSHEILKIGMEEMLEELNKIDKNIYSREKVSYPNGRFFPVYRYIPTPYTYSDMKRHDASHRFRMTCNVTGAGVIRKAIRSHTKISLPNQDDSDDMQAFAGLKDFVIAETDDTATIKENPLLMYAKSDKGKIDGRYPVYQLGKIFSFSDMNWFHHKSSDMKTPFVRSYDDSELVLSPHRCELLQTPTKTGFSK